MRLRELILLSVAVLAPLGQARFENVKSPQAACEFGSVLEYFEELPPIPRTCLAPLAELATPQCRDLLGIQDATAYVAPTRTEVEYVLTTASKTSTVLETVSLASTATVHQLETETQTSTRTITRLAYLPPIQTGRSRIELVTVTGGPVTETLTTTLTTYLPDDRVRRRDELAQTTPDSVSSRDSRSHCESLARQILGMSHQTSVLSGACACLQLRPRTTTMTGQPSDSEPTGSYHPVILTQTRTSTVVEIQAVTYTVTKVHVQSVTQKATTTKVIAAIATATVDVCKRSYKGTRQNGVGNKVVLVPYKYAPSQSECCRQCGQTANCVASAWMPAGPPPQAGNTTEIKPPCQLLIKERPVVLPANASTQAQKLFGPGSSQICPFGVEVYDFGEESAEGRGVVFRGPCSVPKRRLPR